MIQITEEWRYERKRESCVHSLCRAPKGRARREMHQTIDMFEEQENEHASP